MDNMTIHALLKSLSPVATATTAEVEPTPLEITESVTTQKRCMCKKKLALSDFACSKCKVRFCGAHRLPELHACPHDFKKEGKELLEKLNPRIVSEKLDKI